jgi:hypothetical protein
MLTHWGAELVAVALLVFMGCDSPDVRQVHYPITGVSHNQIPPRHATVRVVAGNLIVQETADRWLKDHGYVLTTTGAAVILRLESGEEAAIYGGKTPVIRIIGTEGASGRLLVESRAAMPIAGRSDQLLRDLTCQALATAWGFRPSGQLDIPSALMCKAGSGAQP